MIRLYVLIVVVGLVGGAIAGGYYYYTDSQARIQALIENTAKLQMAKQVQDDTISALVSDQKKFAKLNLDLRANLDKANDYKDVLIGKLRKHNLSNLSLKKPLLVEKRINAATAKLFKSLEVMSGAASAAK
jgi:type II secretory pathway pseudopilin PulG